MQFYPNRFVSIGMKLYPKRFFSIGMLFYPNHFVSIGMQSYLNRFLSIGMHSPSTATFLSSLLSRTRMNSWDRETVSVPSISDKFGNTTNVTSRLQPNHQPDHLPDLPLNHLQNHQVGIST